MPKKKKKYAVYAVASASKYLGEVEAENEEDAKQIAEDTLDIDFGLCHHCSKIDIGDYTDIIAEEEE